MTYAKIYNSILLDPCLEEENIADAMFTVGIAGNNIVAIQKTSGMFSVDDVMFMLNKALEVSQVIKKAIIESLQKPYEEISLL